MTDEEKAEVERRKQETGMATPGSVGYYRNAAYILSAYNNLNEETTSKLADLANSSDPITRRIAKEKLEAIGYYDEPADWYDEAD